MNLKKIWLKIRDREKYLEYKNNKTQVKRKKLYESKIKNFLSQVDNCLATKKEISFLHSGTLGDIINALPIVPEPPVIKTFFIQFLPKLHILIFYFLIKIPRHF